MSSASDPVYSSRAHIVASVAASQKRLRTRTTPGLALTQMLSGDDDADDLERRAMEDEGELIQAAVLVPLIMHPDGVTILLTQRTANLRHHPGQISFPGGHIESDDAGPEAAALREAEEEIGLAASCVEIIGRMDLYRTGTGFEVTPVIGLVEPGFSWQLDTNEVADKFEVPLSFVMDPANHRRERRKVGERWREYYVLPYEDWYIWGATAGMLVNLYEVLSV